MKSASKTSRAECDVPNVYSSKSPEKKPIAVDESKSIQKLALVNSQLISQITNKLGKSQNLIGIENNQIYKCTFCGAIIFQDGEKVSIFWIFLHLFF